MNKASLQAQIQQKQSFLCVGLDTDPKRLPDHLKGDPAGVVKFNRAIVEATKDYSVSYKINTAFYETRGAAGWEEMQETFAMIPQACLTIADAKRGDIGNTSKMYAEAFFTGLDVDAVTVAPYMGSDSVGPFLEYPGKWVIILAHTSNPGAGDFQLLETGGRSLYEQVLETSSQWGSDEQLMYVVGATKAETIAKVRQIVPHHFLLVPGVGAQGGSLEAVCAANNGHEGLLINSSRGIIYASQGDDFAEAAAAKARELQQQMAAILQHKSVS